MNLIHLTRAATALAACAALFATVSAHASAGTFNVSTTITNACIVTDAGPADLAPTYTPATDSGTGAETNLNTFCNGTAPTVTFTDAANSGSTSFVMTSGGNQLFFQIASNPTCNGTPSDLPITEGQAQNLLNGNEAYEICAAVIAGSGLNTTVPAGSYADTVTYTLTP